MENELIEAPYRFDFVQAVRLIYLMLEQDAPHKRYVGYDNAPDREAIKFTASVDLRHCSSDVRAISRLDGKRYSMEVTFLGLVGPSGVLPYHYTRMLRLRLKDNDSTMREFLELFQHRITSNFFRASTKYRLPVQYEFFSYPTRGLVDLISRCLASTLGFGHPGLLGRMGIDDHLFLYYAGHFAHQRATKTGLVRMLADITGFTVGVHEFQVEWLELDVADQTRLSSPYSKLGVDAVVGSRVLSIQNRFRIRLGALTWSQFLSLLPNQSRLKNLAEFTRTYIGLGLDFDFQLVLHGQEVKCARLGDHETARLGWTTWCVSETPQHNVDDAIFEVDTTSITNSYTGG